MSLRVFIESFHQGLHQAFNRLPVLYPSYHSEKLEFHLFGQ